MNKKILLAIILCFVTCISFLEIKIVSTRNNEKDNIEKAEIVTSFYPIYVIMLNLLDGIEDISVTNLTSNQQGCLHDYQLTTEDVRKLQHADLFVMNGGGMEAFMENTLSHYSHLNIVDSSKNITMLEGVGHHHEEEEAHEEEWNAHIWMNPDNYIKQVQTITDSLIEMKPLYEEKLRENSEAYIFKIEILKQKLDEGLQGLQGVKTIIFHEAFSYLCDYLKMEIVHCLDLDTEAGLNAGELAEVVKEIKEENVLCLFVEERYGESVAKSVGSQTDAKIYKMNALATGENSKDSYINGMEQNIKVLKKALQDGVK